VQLYDRTVEVRFPGALRDLAGSFLYQADEGPRIAFDFQRSMRANADQGTVRIWNVPEEIAQRIEEEMQNFRRQVAALQKLRLDDATRATRLKALLENYIVEVWAGYGTDLRLLFRGDIVSMRAQVRDGLDYVTELTLGDGFVVLNEQNMAATFGVGVTPANLLAFAGALADATQSEPKMRAAIALVAPNAASAKMANGWVAQGRPITMIRDIADMLNLQWWYQNGQIYFVRRNEALPDFAIGLDAAQNLLSEPQKRSESGLDTQFFEFTAILTPLVHPGRAVQITRLDGSTLFGRVLEASYSGDTHGDNWTVTALMDDTAQQTLATLFAY
jgi:hypothetical protein